MRANRVPVWTVILALLATMPAAADLAPGLVRQLQQAKTDEQVTVIVTMRPPARRVLPSTPSAVIRGLASLAEDSQRDLVRSLIGRGLSQADYQSLKVTNAVIVTGQPALIRELGRRADVSTVYPDDPVFLIQQQPATRAALSGGNWGLGAIGADRVWRRGIDGRGVIIGSIDTGVDVAHPALRQAWLGGRHAWFDAVHGRAQPYDDHGHGTHTIGIACGQPVGGQSIGVAPGARFIAAKALTRAGLATSSWLLKAMDFMLDPDGNPATDDLPHIVTNSWGAKGNAPYFRDAVANWLAAGIVPVFSIGNEGPSESTTSVPGNYPEVIGVGSVGRGDKVSEFSSRGPVTYDRRSHTKPDLVAPGEDILSTKPSGRTAQESGTSMATPHVTGTIALLLQIRPGQRTEDLRRLLQRTAVDLGPRGIDNLTGAGRLDAAAAVTALLGTSPPPGPTPSPPPTSPVPPLARPLATVVIEHRQPAQVTALLGVVGDPFAALPLRFEPGAASGTAASALRAVAELDLTGREAHLDGETAWYLRLVDQSPAGGVLTEFTILTAGGTRAVQQVPHEFGPGRGVQARVVPLAHRSLVDEPAAPGPTPVPLPTVQVTRTLPGVVEPGGRLRYSLTAQFGSARQQVVTLREALPPGWRLVQASPRQGWFDTAGNELHWRFERQTGEVRISLEVEADWTVGTARFRGEWSVGDDLARPTDGDTWVRVEEDDAPPAEDEPEQDRRRGPIDYNGDGRIDPGELLRWLIERTLG